VNVWDTSDEKRTGGPGHTGYTTYTSEVYCSTQDNRVYYNKWRTKGVTIVRTITGQDKGVYGKTIIIQTIGQ
jgi:hypothetical protein